MANRLTDSYDAARREIRAKEGRDLSPKEFLDTVAPGKRTEKSARDYIRRLRSGERSGTALVARAERDRGKTVNVEFSVGQVRDAATGKMVDDVRSQNVTIPARFSRLDLYRADLRETVNRGLKQSYSRRSRAAKKRPTYEPLQALPGDAKILGVTRLKYVRQPGVVLRVE
jgi:hypothetical protein